MCDCHFVHKVCDPAVWLPLHKWARRSLPLGPGTSNIPRLSNSELVQHDQAELLQSSKLPFCLSNTTGPLSLSFFLIWLWRNWIAKTRSSTSGNPGNQRYPFSVPFHSISTIANLVEDNAYTSKKARSLRLRRYPLVECDGHADKAPSLWDHNKESRSSISREPALANTSYVHQ